MKANMYWRSNRTNTIQFAWVSDLEMTDIRAFFLEKQYFTFI